MKTPEELTALKGEVEMLDKKLAELTEDELTEVVGGKQDPHDYIYETTVNGNTPFLKGISSTPENYKVWFELSPGVRIRVREEGLKDWLGRTYVRCITRVDALEEGYVLQEYVVRKTV